MKKLIRYWNQNRLKIIITVIIIVFIIILIQVINSILKNVNVVENINNGQIKYTSKQTETVITGEKLPEEKVNTNVELIKQFVDYGNKKQYENAYNLLTEDCKNQFYGTLDLFISKYCNNVFATEKTYDLELWYNTSNTYTYRITYIENNILATGNVSSNNNIEDYITIVEEANGNKLSINGFLGKSNINKKKEQEGIELTINERFVYRDFEEYSISIKNNTDKTILLSEGIDSNDICLLDSNNVEYASMLNEIPLINLELSPGMQKTFNISFYKMYNPYRTIEKICFKNIIIDKESFEIDKTNAAKMNINIDI